MSPAPTAPPFRDRRDAGEQLADTLSSSAPRRFDVILGLARGGVPVAGPIARRLGGRLDALIVAKVHVPGRAELAMGAVARVGGRAEVMRHDEVIGTRRVSEAGFASAAAAMVAVLDELNRRYRSDRPPVQVDACSVLLVDDGFATGSTMIAAVRAVRQAGARTVAVAAPVGAADACDRLRREADEVVCTLTPARFGAVGRFYQDFTAPRDEEVRAALEPATTEDSS